MKSTLKAKYFDSKLSLDENLRNVSDRVNESHWNDLMKHWLSKEGIVCSFLISKVIILIKFETYAWLYMLQEASEKNKESRSHQPYTHRTGQRGFSIIHEMEVMFLNLDILLEVSN